MRLFGSDRIAGIMDKLGVEEGEVITHGMVTRSIERAQKKVEARNFSIRKRLLEYDDVMNQQREVIYSLRDKALHSSDVSEDIKTITDDYIDDLLEAHNVNDDWDVDGLQSELSSVMTVDLEESSIHQQPLENLHKVIQDAAVSIYSDREKLVDPDFMRAFERYILLRTIDDKWKDHLYAMDQLREGVNLRAYGQKDPLLEYKSEGFDIFVQALADVNREVIQRLYRTQLHGMQEAPTLRSAQAPSGIQIRHADSTGMGFVAPPQGASSGGPAQQQAAQAGKQKPITVAEKVGRNNPCPCGSGKKYKKCHGNVI
jgi:preprotein translocase subunit SecA